MYSDPPSSDSNPTRGGSGTPSKGFVWTPPEPVTLNAVMPQYEILELLGRGGMGAVYKARQKSLRRTVAIKLLPRGAGGDDPGFADRFKNEAFAIARLNHPGIVTVHDAGETDDGLLYFVMEFVDGHDLSREIASRGALPEAEVEALFLQICEALSYAHVNGIVHRDIKPANLLVDSGRRVRVADFGLAKLEEAAVSGLMTRTGTTVGTLDFMAPELSKVGAVPDARSDLYSFGVTVYQMLTGELPRGMFKMPFECVPGLSRRWDGIICRALEPKPGDRYQTASEMRADLERAGDTVDDLQGTGEVTSAQSFPRKLVIGGVAAALGVAGILSMEERDRRSGGNDPVKVAEATPSAATPDKPFVNSLGMKFVPVPITGGPTDKLRVLFGIWETRAQDYQTFLTETNRKWRKWPQPPHPKFNLNQAPTEAAVFVSWIEAQDFSAWLTERDRKAGIISNDLAYRLPTDHEWSCAAGLGEMEDPAIPPKSKADKLLEVYPWGSVWPPPTGIGNLADQTAKIEGVCLHPTATQEYIEGYDDGIAFIAPVGSFLPTAHGLYDLTGNVAEICQDWFDAEQTQHVERGSCWGNHTASSIASSRRAGIPETGFNHTAGFRLVLVPAATVGPITETLTAAAATTEVRFVNGLGMKFVPVPITGGPSSGQRILFSIWETRAQDYGAFVTETNRKWRKLSQPPHPKFEMDQDPTEAAVFVSWIDAQEFAAWLTVRDRKSGLIGNDLAYRLPTDHEWSCAADLGDKEDPTTLPKAKVDKFLDRYPWGEGWPPPPGSGNFSDQTAKAEGAYAHPGTRQQYLAGYDDGHAFIAPVGSFLPNAHGLYDLAGNVTELCQDWQSEEQTSRVQRNTSWASHTANTMASSWRAGIAEVDSSHTVGFRLVLVPSATVAPVTETQTPGEATTEVRFVNDRGMKFVPVSITGGPTGGQRVLFSIWETRVRDYEWFLRDTKREWHGPSHSPHPDFRWPQVGGTEAAVYVSWLDAKAFAEWLTRKDRTVGLIGNDLAYRLPTDHEWSCTVGLGEKEDPLLPPREKCDLFPNLFPWGTSWPPPPGAGNLADQKARAEGAYSHLETAHDFIDGYDDGFAFIAPVGSFQPNRLGLHDLAGNVEEYVADWYHAEKNERVLRGMHWGTSSREFLKASYRNACLETDTNHLVGFRVVLAPTGAEAFQSPSPSQFQSQSRSRSRTWPGDGMWRDGYAEWISHRKATGQNIDFGNDETGKRVVQTSWLDLWLPADSSAHSILDGSIRARAKAGKFQLSLRTWAVRFGERTLPVCYRAGFEHDTLKIWRVEGNQATVLPGAVYPLPGDFDPMLACGLEFRARGSLLELFLDGERVLSGHDPSPVPGRLRFEAEKGVVVESLETRTDLFGDEKQYREELSPSGNEPKSPGQ